MTMIRHGHHIVVLFLMVTTVLVFGTACQKAVPVAPVGVNPDEFAEAVAVYMGQLNAGTTGMGTLTAKTSVVHIIGFVDITLSDLTVWSNFSSQEKRDYITALGKDLDALADCSIYPGTLPKVGTDTTLFSTNGQKLAERTSLGIVKLS